jgi:very-short-patch-repair endonuclease
MLKRGVVQGQRVSSVKLEAAVRLRRGMTAQERVLWDCLKANHLQGWHFLRQQVIDGLVVDFYCNAAGVVVEVDGGIHESQVEYDQERDNVLRQRGLRVLHVPNERVERDLPALLAEIATECGRCKNEERT